MENQSMVDVPLSPDTKVTVERRGQIVLIGINRPQVFNHIDPETFYGLASAYYDFDSDSSLRAAVLFGHGDNFSRGNDVDAFSALAKSGKAFTLTDRQIDPLARTQKLSKPLVAVVHGDTWNMGHEFHFAADIRVASADVRYAQTENFYGRVPGVAPIRFTREAGWANAMRYLLTGDYWGAQTAHRMGIIQEIAPDRDAALAVGIGLQQNGHVRPGWDQSHAASGAYGNRRIGGCRCVRKTPSGICVGFRLGRFHRGARC
jgi:enoyl-CoA hydratase/carnithine racemase